MVMASWQMMAKGLSSGCETMTPHRHSVVMVAVIRLTMIHGREGCRCCGSPGSCALGSSGVVVAGCCRVCWPHCCGGSKVRGSTVMVIFLHTVAAGQVS